MKQHIRLLAGFAALSLFVTGCHGAGSGASSVLPSNARLTGATASFSVFVPAPSAGVATPESIVVTLLQVNGTSPAGKPAPFMMNLTLSTHGCTAMAGGAISCTATVPAPPGSDTFALSTYSGLNGAGSRLASSQTRASVISDAAKPRCTPMPGAGSMPMGRVH